MHFNFQDLRIFLAVVDEGSLSRAADRCATAVSAASVRLKRLEEEAGCALFVRTARGLALTPAGMRFAEEARKVFWQLRVMEKSVAPFRTGAESVARLATNYNGAMTFLPEDVAAFLKDHPDCRIEQQVVASLEVSKLLVEGKADVGISAWLEPVHGLESFPYRTDRLVLLLPQDHPFANARSLRLRDALGFPFVGLNDNSSMQAFLLDRSRAEGREIEVRVAVSSLSIMARYVCAGVGIGFATQGIFERLFSRDTRLRMAVLEDPWADRTLRVWTRTDRSSVTRASTLLLDALRASGEAFETQKSVAR